MADVVVVATFSIERGREVEALALFESVTEDTHREPGCVKYAWARDLADPTRFVVLERWRSAEDLDAHGASPHLAEFRPAIAAISTEPPVVTRYTPLGIGSEHQGSL